MRQTERTTTDHIFTVDVEEHFHAHALERAVPRDQWAAQPSRVGRNVDVLLDLLARRNATATFFILGWVAERQPALVRRIASAGHEIASHGWSHRRVTSLTPAEFRDEVRSSKQLLEDVSGQPVLGYRAPSFSIVPGYEWAFDVLLEEDYLYDSSLFPIRRPGYGYPGAPPVPYYVRRPAGALVELPLATVRWAGVRVPAAGGAYLRHFPYSLTRRAFHLYSDNGIPGILYVHPWEIDPEQPRLPVSLFGRVRHYRGLDAVLPKVEQLLAEFRFTSAKQLLTGIGRRVGGDALVSVGPS